MGNDSSQMRISISNAKYLNTPNVHRRERKTGNDRCPELRGSSIYYDSGNEDAAGTCNVEQSLELEL